ncbi:MAG: 50S ribosomal protein L19 [Bdellovibrionaceae bacterium]|nr:50S ribosomal protein L19 [Pseudobdellovibrionaceae bacterium]
MTDLVRKVTFNRTEKKEHDPFKAGDTVSVYVKIKEGEKERIQLFKGTVLKVQGSGQGRSFTVRKMSSGVGVEKTFPITSPSIDRIEVLAHGKIRRSKLFYLRELSGRAARIESTLVTKKKSEKKKD